MMDISEKGFEAEIETQLHTQHGFRLRAGQKRKQNAHYDIDYCNEGGAGNPINPNGYATSYLWEEIFAPDSLLE